MALALQILLRCLTGAREIAHGLMPLVRHPDRGELAGPRQLGEAYRIAPVRLHAVAGPLRFARAIGQRAKTDSIDAGVIAHFGEATGVIPRLC